MTTAAQTAQAIRKELKAKFPGHKFSVRSQNYSGGNEVTVYRPASVNSKAVHEVTDKYQLGHFGMDDTYEYSNRNDELPQAYYVFVTSA